MKHTVALLAVLLLASGFFGGRITDSRLTSPRGSA